MTQYLIDGEIKCENHEMSNPILGYCKKNISLSSVEFAEGMIKGKYRNLTPFICHSWQMKGLRLRYLTFTNLWLN